MVTIYISRKPYMASPMAPSHLDLKGQCQGHSFRRLTSSKGAELGNMLLLNINRRAYMERPMALSHLT